MQEKNYLLILRFRKDILKNNYMEQIKGHISQIIGPVIDVFLTQMVEILRKCCLKFMMRL